MSTPLTPCRAKWPGTMTDRDRFVAQMHHQPVDRCFNREFGYWDENFQLWPMFREAGITNNDQAKVFFSFDRMEMVHSPQWLLPAFEEEVLEDRGATLVMRNSEGLVGEVPKDGHSTIPHFTESSITGPDDWQRIKAERLAVDDPQRVIDVEALKRQHPQDRDYPLGVWCGSMIGKVRDLLTMEGLAYAVYDYPDMVEDMVETCCQLVERSLDQLLGEIDFDFAGGWEDIACNTGPLVSMDFFTRVVVPRYKRIGSKLRDAGIDIWYTDCDGDVRPMLPHFLEAGINVMFPWEVNGSGHPGKLLDEYGPELRIMGGVDKMRLAKGPEAIREWLESLAPYVARGGFIPHCDHRCPPDVSQENYLYYLDLKQQMFG